jgi:hypothetical protein
MQLGAQKLDMLVDLLTVELGLLVVLLGRRFGAGWRISHAAHRDRTLHRVAAQLAVQASGSSLPAPPIRTPRRSTIASSACATSSSTPTALSMWPS